MQSSSSQAVSSLIYMYIYSSNKAGGIMWMETYQEWLLLLM